MTITDETIRSCLLQLVSDRGPEKTICPSEVARALGQSDWRDLMPRVRRIGIHLAESGNIVVTQKSVVVDPKTANGPIRYRLNPE